MSCVAFLKKWLWAKRRRATHAEIDSATVEDAIRENGKAFEEILEVYNGNGNGKQRLEDKPWSSNDRR